MKGVIIGIVLGIIVGVLITIVLTTMLVPEMIRGNSSKEAFDLENLRYINGIGSCLDLKMEYQLIKKYELYLEYHDLYLQAIQERAEEIVNSTGQSCILE